MKKKKTDFDFVILDKNKKVLEYYAWKHAPSIEIKMSKNKAKQAKFWQIRNAKTEKSILKQKLKLVNIQPYKKELCTILIDLSECFEIFKK